jgi:hypothetical protein
MNTAEVLNSEKQEIFRMSTLSDSTVIALKDQQGTHSVSFNKIMNFCGIFNCNWWHYRCYRCWYDTVCSYSKSQWGFSAGKLLELVFVKGKTFTD